MEQYLISILEFSLDVHYYYDIEESKFLYVNPAIKEHFGILPGEILEKDYTYLIDIVHPKEREAFEKHWANIFSSENNHLKSTSCDYRCRSQSGKFFWYNETHRFLMNEQGQSKAVIGHIRDITDLKVVDILKSTSKERYNMAMEAASDSIWEWRVPSNRLFFDDRFYFFLGYDPYEFPDTFPEWETRIHPDDRSNAMSLLNLCATGISNQIHIEYRIKTKDNYWKWILCRAKVSRRNDDGKIIKIIGTQTDITRLKEAEQDIKIHNEALREAEKTIQKNTQALQILYNNLKESDERLKLFFNEAKNIAFIMLEPKKNDLIVTEFSAGGENIFGLERDKVLQHSLTQVFNNGYNKHFVNLINTINKTNEEYKGELTLYHNNGNSIASLLTVHIIMNGNADHKSILAIITDINERKQFEIALHFKNEELTAAEEELTATNDELKFVNEEIQSRNIDLRMTNEKLIDSEEKFRELAENTNDAFWLRDDKQILYINPSFEKVWGRKRKEIFENSQNFERWVHPEDRNRFNKWIDFSVFSNIKVYPEQYRIIKSDGSIRWLWSRIHPVYNSNGQIYRLAGIATDITEQKETEDALIRAKEKAFESDKLKSAFLANISHEIRTPMNGIMGFIELLNDKSLSQETREQYVSIISKSSKQLLQIINDIIDISKIEANQVKIDIRECNINSAIKDIFLFYQNDKGILENENLELKLDLPLEEEYAKIFTDESRLRQILMNLLDNAVKFTLRGEITVGYRLLENKKLEFFIKDTGIGIPTDQYHLVFERFRQADNSATRQFGGTGLGLSISEGLAKLMEGFIWFESETGKGTTFYLTLPYKPIKKRLETNIESDIPEPNWKDKIILVVEDDEINFEYLKTILEPSNAIVLHASSGEDALRIFSSTQRIDIILMDIRLPGINGYEAMRAIKDQNPLIPIIAQTAFAMTEDNVKCLEQGFNDYIAKPIKRKHLLNIIHKQLNLY